MKKLLTVLLAFVIALCLVNLNSNHTKADDPITSYGLKIDSAGLTTNSGGSVPSDVATYSKATHTLTIKKDFDLPGSITDIQVVKIDSSINQLTIEIESDINLEANAANSIFTIDSTNTDLTIKGNGKKLYIYNGRTYGIRAKSLTLNNVNLEVFSEMKAALSIVNSITLNNSKAKIYTNGSETALKLDNNSTPPATVTKAIGYYESPDKTDLVWNNINYIVPAESNESPVYIELNDPDVPFPTPPTPTPDPGKKDESCEKVIGPTWHWNNEKGVCEEYATVGTSTR